MTALTRAGADAGGISSPLARSLAFAVGVQMSTSAGVRPPVRQAAEAPPGTARAATIRAIAMARPVLSLKPRFGKPISPSSAYGVSCRAGAERARASTGWWISPENVVPPLPLPDGLQDSASRSYGPAA